METHTVSSPERMKAGRRMRAASVADLEAAISTLTTLRDWAQYADQQEQEEQAPDPNVIQRPDFFSVIKTDGGYRWLALSSNAFKDREDEIVSTAALQEAIEYGEKTGDRGTLRLWHIPGADIGTCDFQGLEGRFLVESGTFDNTPLAQKALEYFESGAEPLGMSIGFRYPPSTKQNGVYKAIRIFERSVCPLAVAANPWTAFHAPPKGDPMDQRQKDWLASIAGPDKAAEILGTAASATKQLEGTVEFKTVTDERQALKTAIDAIGDEGRKAVLLKAMDEAYDDNEEPSERMGDAEGSEDTSSEDEDGVAKAMSVITTALSAEVTPILDALKAIVGRVEALEQASTKTAGDASRASRVFDAPRPTTLAQNIIDAAVVKNLGGGKTEQPTNPVAPFIADLLGTRGI